MKRSFAVEAESAGVEVKGDSESVLKRVKRESKAKRRAADGRSNAKIRSESGALIPASFQSGRYTSWLNKSKQAHIDHEPTGIGWSRV